MAPRRNAPAPSVNPVELSLIAGQFIFFNNNADSIISFNKTDAFMFETQLLGRFQLFGGAVSIVEAPDVQIWNNAGLGPTGSLPGGNPNPATSVTATSPAGALGGWSAAPGHDPAWAGPRGMGPLGPGSSTSAVVTGPA